MWGRKGQVESESLFSLIFPKDTILDLHISYVMADGACNQLTWSAAPANDSVAYAPLDCLNGSGAAGTNLWTLSS